MATLPVYTTSQAGIDVTADLTAAAVAGDSFPNTGSETLIIKNADTNPMTLTLVYTSGVSFNGVTPSNKTVTVGASNILEIGPFPLQFYGSTMSFTYSAVTSLTVMVRKTG